MHSNHITMNWICSLIVFQYTILLLHARPEVNTTTTTTTEKITLEMGHPSSFSAMITTSENRLPAEIAIPDIKKHLTADIGISPPLHSIKRGLSTPQVKKIEAIKKATNMPELVTFSTVTTNSDSMSKTTRVNEELNTKQKPLASTTTSTITTMAVKSEPAAIATTLNAEKPTIFDIISETEKNQTKHMNRVPPVVSSTIIPPTAAISPQSPIQGARHGDSPKAIGHHVEIHQNGHPGVAEPLTWQQLESEMSFVDQNLKDLKESSTSKDGISTWILLSGSDQHKQMIATPATTTVSHVEKVDIKDTLNDRPNYRFGEVHNGDKKPNKKVETKKPKPDKKNKVTNSTTTARPTVTTSTTSGILLASDFTTEKSRWKIPLANLNKLVKRKPITTTTTTSTAAPIVIDNKNDDTPTTVEDAEMTTPVSFIVLEPKIAGFDLPQDRSPATKKPQKVAASKPKRKSTKKNKVTSVTKKPNKAKEKPISTTIYNYLSREIMPSVGILGAGILLTAGVASYIFGPFGALRRSYDDASDRKDNIDNIYSVNSEEYANEGTDSGQHEEEVFSKFLAGMPSRDVPRYVKYFRPDGSHVNQPVGPNHPYRSQVRLQQQASQMAPKYSPYMRYRNAPSPHFNAAQYNPQQQQQQHQKQMQQQQQEQYAAYRNQQVNTQSAQQVQPQVVAAPVYNPQYHEIQKQKSFANNMDTILKHQTTIYGKTSPVSVAANVIEEKSVQTDILADSEDDQQLQASEGQVSDVDINENERSDDISAQMQRRTNTYVVGSAITDNEPGEAIVSASMTASVDGLPSEHVHIVEPVNAVTSSSHGPRRRRRDTSANTQKPDAKDVTDKLRTSSTSTSTTTTSTTKKPTTSAPTQSNRLYSSSDLSALDAEFSMLREKIMSFDRDYTNEENEKKIEKKIQTEFKSISNDYEALKKAIDGAKAIEHFEKQVRIRAKNFELSVVLKTGITVLRQRITYLSDLVEHPEDNRIIEKINRRDGSSSGASDMVVTSTSNSTTTSSNRPEVENGFIGFLKVLQLKAQFGLNLLQNIRPSFERAFEQVFKRPYEKEN